MYQKYSYLSYILRVDQTATVDRLEVVENNNNHRGRLLLFETARKITVISWSGENWRSKIGLVFCFRWVLIVNPGEPLLCTCPSLLCAGPVDVCHHIWPWAFYIRIPSLTHTNGRLNTASFIWEREVLRLTSMVLERQTMAPAGQNPGMRNKATQERKRVIEVRRGAATPTWNASPKMSADNCESVV